MKKVEKLRAWVELSEGAYMLRTNVSGWSDEDLWRAYIQLTDAETAFRIQKSDLALRPVWHQKEERVLAHILVCFPAYVLWKFLGQLCQQAGLGNEPRRVLDELSEFRAVDVVLPTQDGHEIRTRCVTQPDDHQKILLERLGLTVPGRLHKTDLEWKNRGSPRCGARTYVKRWGSWASARAEKIHRDRAVTEERDA